MSASSNHGLNTAPESAPMPTDAVFSDSLADLLIPGVVVELDPLAAEALGAFEEIALTDAEAWEANADLGMDEADDGD
jgi:hypothetical protein